MVEKFHFGGTGRTLTVNVTDKTVTMRVQDVAESTFWEVYVKRGGPIDNFQKWQDICMEATNCLYGITGVDAYFTPEAFTTYSELLHTFM